MKIGIIGLGDIARKAYLPVLAATPGIVPHLCTRDEDTLAELGAAYRIDRLFTGVEELLAAGVEAAFVHAATSAHVPIVEALLEADVHVYVDKPLSDEPADSERLVRLARKRDRSLMVGFNRRYAPGYVALRDLPRDLVILEKNRVGAAAAPRTVVFDDFIHVVDTLRFLVPGEVTDVRVRTRVRSGLLEHVVLELGGDGFTAIGVMNRVGGATEETCEVMGGGRKRRVLDLGDVVDHDGGEILSRRPPWTPVARQRGIEQICHAFLDAVRAGDVLRADDALITHAMCEEVVSTALADADLVPKTS
ncbi:Gfo/Idh/MocA family protein [Microtetraspora fusca]|uniref:Gfo/Idh/MocA family protein n=1 Tax=Microtetraspora fusca TaxID=1997 RepID=UPI000831C5DE|nr:Gfo/Idh/MocA family oxidoreductase [Microtetraspora fusca]